MMLPKPQRRDGCEPSAPPLSPPPRLNDSASAVDVYALPVAQPVDLPYAHPLFPRPLQLPTRQQQHYSPIHNQDIRRFATNAETTNYSTASTDPIRSVHIESSDDVCCPSAWPISWFLVRLFAFHVANIALGLVAAACVYTGLALSILMLPLCGYGVVIFQVLLETTFYLCYIDARVHNWIADYKKLAIAIPEPLSERSPLLPLRNLVRNHARTPQFDVRGLRGASARSVATVFYFGAWKLLLVVATMVTLLVFAYSSWACLSDADAEFRVTLDGREMMNTRWHWFAVVAVSIVLLHVVGRVSQATTRFFCCKH